MTNNVPPNLPTEENVPEPTMISPEEIPEAPVTSSEEIAPKNMDEKYKKVMEYGQKGILGVLIAAFLIVGIYGLIKVVPYIITSLGGAGISLSSIFKPNETLEIDINTMPIISGKQFEFSVVHRGPTQTGEYTWGYECGQGEVFVRTLTTDQSIRCGEDNSIEENDTQNFVVKVAENTEIDFYATFIGVDGRKLTARETVDVTNGTPRTTVTPTVREPSQNTPKAKTTTGGRPDFTIALLQSGIAVGTNSIIPTAILAPENRAGVKFLVTNSGNVGTGPWQFRAIVPNQNPGQVYFSPLQSSLMPGDSIEFTLGFDGTNGSPVGIVLIQVDVNDFVKESSEDNNNLSVTFSRTGGQYPQYQDSSYNYNYNNRDNEDYYGKPDLEGEVFEVGFIDNDGDFEESTSISSSDDAAIRIRVENNGTDETGEWEFDVEIEVDGNRYAIVHEEDLRSIRPGDSKTITVELPNLRSDEVSDIIVTLDPNDRIDEQRESNNEFDDRIRVN